MHQKDIMMINPVILTNMETMQITCLKKDMMMLHLMSLTQANGHLKEEIMMPRPNILTHPKIIILIYPHQTLNMPNTPHILRVRTMIHITKALILPKLVHTMNNLHTFKNIQKSNTTLKKVIIISHPKKTTLQTHTPKIIKLLNTLVVIS